MIGRRLNRVSSHVRIIATHPLYGVLLNSQACKTIEGQFALSRQFCDVKWPRWKRIVWLAKNDSKWKVKVFRVPRKSKLRKSIFGREILLTGLQLPPKKRKKNRNKDARVYKVGYEFVQRQNRANVGGIKAKRQNFVDEDGIYDEDLPPNNVAQALPQNPILFPQDLNIAPEGNWIQQQYIGVLNQAQPNPLKLNKRWDAELEELIRHDREMMAREDENR